MRALVLIIAGVGAFNQQIQFVSAQVPNNSGQV